MDYAADLTNATEMSVKTYYTNTSDYDYDYDYGDEESQDQSHYSLAIFYSLVFAFSLCTNVLVLVIIYRFERLTTVTNLLLLNLVLSSLLSSLPFVAAYEVLPYWPFGGFMCKAAAGLYFLGFFSSVLFLALLTFDRHLAVVYSISAARLRTRAYAVVSCGAVWVVSALACIKPMIIHKLLVSQINGRTLCQEHPEMETPVLWAVGFYTQLLLFFLFPLLLIVYCYTRIACTVLSTQIGTKFKTVRLIFVIVLLFFTCWTPFNIAMVMHVLSSTEEGRDYWENVLDVTKKLAYVYFCISPIFYTFVGKKFRNYFLLLLVKRFPGLTRHISVSQSRANMSTQSTPNVL